MFSGTLREFKIETLASPIINIPFKVNPLFLAKVTILNPENMRKPELFCRYEMESLVTKWVQ